MAYFCKSSRLQSFGLLLLVKEHVDNRTIEGFASLSAFDKSLKALGFANSLSIYADSCTPPVKAAYKKIRNIENQHVTECNRHNRNEMSMTLYIAVVVAIIFCDYQMQIDMY